MIIESNLKKLGFSDKDILVYKALLKSGKSNHSNIAKITGVNRATVYNVAKNLINKGLITEDIGSKGSFLIAEPPQKLKRLIERSRREIEEKERLIDEAVEELEMIASQNTYPVPKIRFVSEDNLNDFLRENMPTWAKSAIESDGCWWGTQDYTFSENFGKFNEFYWKQDYSQKITMNLITNDSAAERINRSKFKNIVRTVKSSNQINCTASIWVGGDYTIMVVTRNRPFYLFEIHDKALASNLRGSYKKLWEDTKSVAPQIVRQ